MTRNPHDASPVEIDSAAGPARAADELLAHGLLSHLALDSAGERERRVARVLGALDAPGRVGPLALLGRAPARWIGIAAAVGIAAVAIFFTSQVQSSAQAVVQQSISALRSPGDKRYELRITHDEGSPAQTASGTVDTRDGGLLLMRFNAPNGREVIVGRDEDGPWAIRPDGQLEREHPERAWPKWATVGEETIAADSVDRLLEELAKTHAIERRGVEELEGKNGRRFLHLAGEHKPGSGPGAARVELWIDRESKLIERLEMRWDARQPGRRPPLPPRAGRDQGPEDGPGEGPPPADVGGPPDDDAPPPDDMDDPERSPEGPEHDAGRAHPPGRVPPPGLGPAGPRGPDGQPARRFRPLPPRLLVLERVDAAPFESDWFSPFRHLQP